jgi:hypothetical protein
MQIFRKSIYLFFFILSISCENKKEPEVKGNSTVVIGVESNYKNFKRFTLDELNAKVEYIPLETSDNNPIDRIRNIDIKHQYIVVVSTENVYLFSNYGKYFHSIGSYGKGPDAYNMPVSAIISEDKVFISDLLRNLILEYSTENIFIQSIPITKKTFSSAPLNAFYPISSSEFLIQVVNYSGYEMHRLLRVNTKGQVLMGYPNTTYFTLRQTNPGEKHPFFSLSSANTEGHIYKHENMFRYMHRLNDTIWNIAGDDISPLYVLHRGNLGLPAEFLGYSITDEAFQTKVKESLKLRFVNETNSFLFVTYFFANHYPFSFRKSPISRPKSSTTGISQGFPILGVYNKTTTEFFFVAPSGVDHQLEPLGIENDIDGGINFAPMYSPDERTLVSWFNAYDLKAHVASEAFRSSTPKYPERKRELEALANHLKDDDNPVLMVVTFEE